MTIHYQDDAVTLHLGDCLDVLRGLPDASVDAVVTDPPYNLPGGFLGKDWDNIGAGREFQDWCEQWAAECLRALKPGGHLLAFGGSRTYHRLASGIEDAGFEIRGSIPWIHSQGFPKGQDIGKCIDRHRDDRSDILKVTEWLREARNAAGWTTKRIDKLFGTNGMASHWTATASVAASVPTPEQWAILRESLGFDDTEIQPTLERVHGRRGELGDAWNEREVIGEATRIRRPSNVQVAGLSDGDYKLTAPASQAARRWSGWNTSLRPANEPIVMARRSTGFDTTVANVLKHGTGALNVEGCRIPVADGAGRWPTDVVLSHSPWCVAERCEPGCPVVELDAQTGVLASGANPTRRTSAKFTNVYGEFAGVKECTPVRGANSGGGSRFYPTFRYEAKAAASERPKLADGTQHVSVKPLELMRWLVRLVCPPDGVVLDPFAGSGTTLEAATLEGFRSIGIEREPDYAELCVQRLSKPLQPSLFG